MDLRRALLLVLLVLLPLDGSDWLRIPIAGVPVSATDLLVAALLFLDFLAGTLRPRALPRLARTASWLALAAAAASCTSLLYASGPRIAQDVKLTLNLFELAALVYLCARLLPDPARLRQALLAATLGTVLMSGLTVAKAAGLDVPGRVRLSSRSHLGPLRMGVTAPAGGVAFGTTLALGLAPLVAGAPGIGVRLALPLAALVGLAGAVSHSRNVWIAMGVEALAALAIVALARGRPGRRLLAGLVAAAAAALLALHGAALFEALRSLRPATLVRRVTGYLHGLDLATGSLGDLLFGAGRGRFVDTVETEVVPHNVALDVLVSKGLVTLLPLAALVGVVGVRLWRAALADRVPGRRALARVLAVALAGELSLGQLAPVTSSLAFLAAVALGAACAALPAPEAAPRAPEAA